VPVDGRPVFTVGFRAVNGKKEAARDPMPKRLGRYDVRGRIGEGGMASVFLGYYREATDGRGRLVAMKVIKEIYSLNQEFVTMFTDEAKIVSRLNHPNIVKVHELGVERNRLFMAMEFLNGQSLWNVWAACRDKGVRLRYDVAAWIGARVAEGLHHAHELRDEHGQPLDLVHRDVNGSNIFINYDGQVKVIDFGLAKAANKVSKTRAGMVKGKLAYMSPEQTVGDDLDRRTDVFALATTLWELTVDQRLFKGKDEVDTLQRVHSALVPNAMELVEGYPEDLWLVLATALQRDPEDRYPSSAQMAIDLDRFARSSGRPVNEEVVAGIMQALFSKEKAEHEAWVADATRAEPAGAMPMKPQTEVVVRNLDANLDADLSRPADPALSRRGDFAPASIRRPSQQLMAAVRPGEDVWAPRSMAGSDGFGAGPPSAEVWMPKSMAGFGIDIINPHSGNPVAASVDGMSPADLASEPWVPPLSTPEIPALHGRPASPFGGNTTPMHLGEIGTEFELPLASAPEPLPAPITAPGAPAGSKLPLILAAAFAFLLVLAGVAFALTRR
jgi:serine/threonine protein kinase